MLEFPKVLSALAEHAVSPAGKEACLLVRPYERQDEIIRQAGLLDQAVTWAGESGFKLHSFPQLEGLFDYIRQPHSILDQDDLVAMRAVLHQAREARSALSGSREFDYDALFDEVTGGKWPETAWSGIQRCLDPEGRLKDDASPELFGVRQEIRQIHQRCSKKVKDFILGEDLGHFLQDEFMTISSDRYVLPLKANFKGRFKGIIHDYSQTGETCYFEPMFLVEMNNQLQQLKREEREQERQVFKYLTGLVQREEESILEVYAGLIRLDVLLAKVGLGAAFEGRVLYPESGQAVKLMDARHPLLALGEHGARPVDVELLDGQTALIISGGNAGGKTVCLKTVGLLALMAMAGLPVPVAGGSTLPVWKKIFVIMGDEQSLEDNVSTFTAQIRSLSNCWDGVDADTLYILDEFGAGTDPTQGAALAQAVIDGLLERGSTTFAATHFPALKAYAMGTQGVRAASVLFDPSTKRPLFRLAYDQVGASIALDVAREHGLPAELLEKAEQYLLLDGSDTSALLDRLNELAVQREKRLDELDAERNKFDRRKARLEQDFAKERDKLAGELRSVSQKVLKDWKAGKVGRKQALKQLSEAKAKAAFEKPEQTRPKGFGWEDVANGDTLKYLPWDKTGQVVDTNDRKQQVKLDLDGVSMWVAFDTLAPAQSRPESPARPASTVNTGSSMASHVLDLRGKRSDEALAELERYIDAALLQEAGNLEIVHGRGTGALRREVHAFLKRHPAVESFSLAPEDRGGDGMTEVRLK